MEVFSFMMLKSAGQNTAFSTNKTLNIQGSLLDLGTPRVMGIVNVTPDSFYDHSRAIAAKEILSHTEKMLTEGATFIDVGGYSSRPGAADISQEEELKRVLEAIKLIAKEFPSALISVDTFRSEVARQAVSEGACMINDISTGELDPQMLPTVAVLNIPYVAMHMRGTPQTMKENTMYENLIMDIISFFHAKVAHLHALGIKDILIDPGFGFSKTIEQNFQLLNHLHHFGILGKPILAGLSRKSLIWKTLDVTPAEALPGTIAMNMTALIKGADILRVHDVKEAIDTIKLFLTLQSHTASQPTRV